LDADTPQHQVTYRASVVDQKTYPRRWLEASDHPAHQCVRI